MQTYRAPAASAVRLAAQARQKRSHASAGMAQADARSLNVATRRQTFEESEYAWRSQSGWSGNSSRAIVFERAGLACLVYDHRSIGHSKGEPRNEVDPWQQATICGMLSSMRVPCRRWIRSGSASGGRATQEATYSWWAPLTAGSSVWLPKCR